MNELINNKTIAEILAEEIDKLPYETVIEHEQIESIIGVPRGLNKYGSTIAKAKKLLIEKRKHIESIRGVGYRIVAPDNVIDRSLHHIKRGCNEIKKGQEILDHAPVNDMSAEGREAYRRVYDRAVILDAAMKGAAVELKELAGKRPHPFLFCKK